MTAVVIVFREPLFISLIFCFYFSNFCISLVLYSSRKVSQGSHSGPCDHSSGHSSATLVLGLHDLHRKVRKNYMLDRFYSYLDCLLSSLPLHLPIHSYLPLFLMLSGFWTIIYDKKRLLLSSACFWIVLLALKSLVFICFSFCYFNTIIVFLAYLKQFCISPSIAIIHSLNCVHGSDSIRGE